MPVTTVNTFKIIEHMWIEATQNNATVGQYVCVLHQLYDYFVTQVAEVNNQYTYGSELVELHDRYNDVKAAWKEVKHSIEYKYTHYVYHALYNELQYCDEYSPEYVEIWANINALNTQMDAYDYAAEIYSNNRYVYEQLTACADNFVREMNNVLQLMHDKIDEIEALLNDGLIKSTDVVTACDKLDVYVRSMTNIYNCHIAKWAYNPHLMEHVYHELRADFKEGVDLQSILDLEADHFTFRH